ncbi:hypothetical protein H2198_008086 [Neophaeococcomyces mojaviensis]|uniref:Uncharacterized protein n=1 Tax=Neophaeococcomyces mojaviensis TaxID=3383035 RepID=A0ACC2ZYK5_9EURO|nr:hypothetical protein H2198_008086 [Knufia sp. JES_112]
MPAKYTNKLNGKRVLVLGGTSGIGFCVAENALENGATVIVASSRQESVDKTLSRLTTSYPDMPSSRILGHVIDLRSPDSEKSIIELLDFATNDKKDLLDHIVSTAGDSIPIQPLSAFSDAEVLTNAQRVRILAPLFVAKHAKEYMHVSPRSSITVTGGVNSYQPGNGWVLPAISGNAIDGMVRGLAVDLRPIRVNAVAPGAVWTELFQRTFTGEQLEQFKQKFAKQTLVGDVGSPEDVSEAYLYVMRDAFITGQIVLTEGGLLLAPGAQR